MTEFVLKKDISNEEVDVYVKDNEGILCYKNEKVEKIYNPALFLMEERKLKWIHIYNYDEKFSLYDVEYFNGYNTYSIECYGSNNEDRKYEGKLDKNIYKGDLVLIKNIKEVYYVYKYGNNIKLNDNNLVDLVDGVTRLYGEDIELFDKVRIIDDLAIIKMEPCNNNSLRYSIYTSENGWDNPDIKKRAFKVDVDFKLKEELILEILNEYEEHDIKAKTRMITSKLRSNLKNNHWKFEDIYTPEGAFFSEKFKLPVFIKGRFPRLSYIDKLDMKNYYSNTISNFYSNGELFRKVNEFKLIEYKQYPKYENGENFKEEIISCSIEDKKKVKIIINKELLYQDENNKFKYDFKEKILRFISINFKLFAQLNSRKELNGKCVYVKRYNNMEERFSGQYKDGKKQGECIILKTEVSKDTPFTYIQWGQWHNGKKKGIFSKFEVSDLFLKNNKNTYTGYSMGEESIDDIVDEKRKKVITSIPTCEINNKIKSIMYDTEECLKDFSCKVLERKIEIINKDKANRQIEKLKNDLIGLKEVKEEIEQIAKNIIINEKKQELGLKTLRINRNYLFLGNEGTGKKEVASRFKTILFNLGIIKEDKLVVVNGKNLIGENKEDTKLRIMSKIKEGINGVLLIEIVQNSLKEIHIEELEIEDINKAIEFVEENNMIIIISDTSEEVRSYLLNNRNLARLFNRYMIFKDYKVEELRELYIKFLNENNWSIDKELTNEEIQEGIGFLVGKYNIQGIKDLVENTIEYGSYRLIEDISDLSILNKEGFKVTRDYFKNSCDKLKKKLCKLENKDIANSLGFIQ